MCGIEGKQTGRSEYFEGGNLYDLFVVVCSFVVATTVCLQTYGKFYKFLRDKISQDSIIYYLYHL